MRRATHQLLMTADAVGGVWTYAMELARGLSPRGVHVTLALIGPPPSAAQRDEVAALPNVTMHERPCRLEWMEEPWADVAAAGDWLLQLEQAVAPDVVHLNGYAHGALPFRAPAVVVGHSCVVSWWHAVHGGEPPASWRQYETAVAAGLASADLVVAPTSAMLSALETHYGPLPRATVIANGRTAPAGAAQRPKEPMIFSAGRLWDAAKNVEAVCAVADRLAWTVYVAGDLSDPDGRTRVGPVTARVLGRVSPAEMWNWLSRASIYALPARYEPFGLSVLEAALAGCALVLGDIRSLREVWGPAALYVPPDNRRALASALQRLIENDERRADLAARALLRARELTADRMADAYAALYDTLAGAAPHKGAAYAQAPTLCGS